MSDGATGVRAPADGVYAFRFTGETADRGRRTGTSRTTVSTSSRSADDVRQAHDTQITAEGENGTRPSRHLRWTASGVYQRGCSPSEIEVLRFPLTTGMSWTVSNTCESDSPVGAFRMDETTTVTVGVSREVTVIGRRLTVSEIVTESVKNVRFGAHNMTRRERQFALFSPELLFDVRLEETVWQNGDQITARVDELTGFTPA